MRMLSAVLWRFLYVGMIVCISVDGAAAQDAEFVIAKYGKLLVTSTLPDARIYVDDTYRGRAGTVIEGILAGEHIISCRKEAESLTGKFLIRKDETLKLDANFDDDKLTVHVEHEKVEKAEKPVPAEKPVKAEAPKPEKPKAEVPKPEKPKKTEVAKKEDKKSPQEERRSLHLNMIKAYFEDLEAQEVKIFSKVNQKVISKFTEKKNHGGTFYRTKKDVLLCDKGPCEQQWSVAFVYTDETGKADTIGLTWTHTVFNGITPQGTNKRDMLFCVGSECNKLEDTAVNTAPIANQIGRYHLTWTKSSLVIRRSDIMKEITASGGLVEAY